MAKTTSTQLLSEKTCLITGAGGGVGRGMALAMAAAGANIVIAARRAETGEPVAKEIEKRGGTATFKLCDVAKPQDIDNAVKNTLEVYGKLDCFIHNALSFAGKPEQFIQTLPETWESLSATALRASYYSARAAYPALKESSGSLILISSSAGVEGSSSLPVYAAVKAGQRALAKSLAKEWGPNNIRVNLVNPVAMTEAMERAYKLDPKLAERLTGRTPLGRIGDPEMDIGQAVIFLASPLSHFITGQTLTIDGGNFLGL